MHLLEPLARNCRLSETLDPDSGDNLSWCKFAGSMLPTVKCSPPGLTHVRPHHQQRLRTSSNFRNSQTVHHPHRTLITICLTRQFFTPQPTPILLPILSRSFDQAYSPQTRTLLPERGSHSICASSRPGTHGKRRAQLINLRHHGATRARVAYQAAYEVREQQ